MKKINYYRFSNINEYLETEKEKEKEDGSSSEKKIIINIKPE